MKFFALSLLFTLSASSVFAKQIDLPVRPYQCIQLQQAQKILGTYLSSVVGQVPTNDFPWLSDYDPALSIKDVQKALRTLKWNPKKSVFETTAVVDGYCAQGASCWGWYTIDCAGTIGAAEDGED